MRFSYIILFLLILCSCKNKGAVDTQESIARVNDTYLYKKDIKNVVPEKTESQDSIHMIRNFINIWATRQLFIDQSKRNLKDDKLSEYDELVEDYRNTLYINAYTEAIINKAVDMEITDQDFMSYYEDNLENFNLNEELVKLRYLHLPTEFNDMAATKVQFNRFNDEDEEYLKNKKLEFIKFSFSDSTWASLDQVYTLIPVLKKQERKSILKKEAYIQLEDSLGVYMIKIEDVLNSGEVAPLAYSKPTIRHIILSRRRRELIKKLEKDIIKDAIENKQFEVYE